MNCPTCHAPNAERARFCQNCGSTLQPQRPVQGERKFVTVLFADVVGSTTMAEQLDAEQVAEIMNGAFAHLNAPVARYGGTVARLMGDAILALFGAPLAHEDHADRAVRAGLEIQAAAHEYARSVEQTYGVGFSVRVGITSGLAVLAFVGDEIKTEYTAMGDTANIAARLQAAAAPGAVLISAETYHLVKELFEVKAHGPLELKGRSAPIDTYEVVALRAVPGKVRGLPGLSSPLVGRDAEISLLRGELDALRAGGGALVVVAGEAGVGKSRLAAELRTLATAEHQASLTWLEGRALSYGQTISYHPWRPVLRQAIGAQEGDAPAVRDKLGRAAAHGRLPATDVPFLEAVLAVESDQSLQQLTALDGETLVQQITGAVRRYLRAAIQAGPTVLVFDDLHWADAPSLELLLGVAALAESEPLLVVCLLRPDKEAPSWRFVERARGQVGDRYAEVMVQPLDQPHARELLSNLLHIQDLPESVRELILRKSEGNPFFLEEVLRSLIDGGHLVREDGHWRATREIAAVAIPDTLTGVLSARIDRLPEATKQVAQTAAVLGRVFAQRALTGVCAAAPPPERIEDIEPHLWALTYEELVRERARDPELEYIFKHALTQEAAYDLLLLKRRRELHRRAGEVLERLYVGRTDELAPVLAHHFWLGEDWARAAEYALRAGARARAVYALREALEHYQRARAALDKLPDAPPEQVYNAILGWTFVAYRLGLHDQLLEPLQRAEAIARQLGDTARLAEALAWIGNAHLLAGFPSRAVPVLRESSQLASALGDERLSLLPLFMVSITQMDRDPRAALTQMDQVLELARKYQVPDIEAHELALKGAAHARLGEFERAQQAIEAALAMLPRLNSAVKQADVYIGVGMAYIDMGEVQRGVEYTRRGAEISLDAKGLDCACAGYVYTGVGDLRLPDLPSAQEALEQAASLGEQLEGFESSPLAAMAHGALARVRFASGRVEAVDDMHAALENARTLGDEYTAAVTAQALGEAYARLSNDQRAEQHLSTALSYYRRHELRPYLVGALQSLADVYEQQGRTAEALQARSEAEALAQELGRSAPAPSPATLG